MSKAFIFLAVLFTVQVAFAQTTLKVVVKDEVTKEAVAGANVTIKDTAVSATTDAQGVVQLSGVPDGPQTLVVFSPGYETKELNLNFPLLNQREFVVFMKVTDEVGQVTITSTRTGRSEERRVGIEW